MSKATKIQAAMVSAVNTMRSAGALGAAVQCVYSDEKEQGRMGVIIGSPQGVQEDATASVGKLSLTALLTELAALKVALCPRSMPCAVCARIWTQWDAIQTQLN